MKFINTGNNNISCLQIKKEIESLSWRILGTSEERQVNTWLQCRAWEPQFKWAPNTDGGMEMKEHFPEMAKLSMILSHTETSPGRQKGVTQVKDRKERCFYKIVTFAKFQMWETADPGLETDWFLRTGVEETSGKERDGEYWKASPAIGSEWAKEFACLLKVAGMPEGYWNRRVTWAS